MTTLTLQGTPVEIGTDLWCQLVLPVLAEAQRKAQPDQVAQFYSGMLIAAMGSMAADFGHESAVDIVRQLLSTFERMGPHLDGSAVQ